MTPTIDKQFVLNHNLRDVIRTGSQEAVREYMQVFSQLTPREKGIKAIRQLRFYDSGYIEEIPETIVHSTNGNYKCRSGWFNTVFWNLEALAAEGILDESQSKKVLAVQTDINKRLQTSLTKREDIDETNAILRETIEHLITRYQIKPEEFV